MKTKTIVRKSIMFLLTVTCLLLVLFLPGILLRWQSNRELNMVKNVPREWYQSENSAISKEFSGNLTSEEKLQLVRGEWKSEILSAGEKEMKLGDYQAVELARKRIGKLYQAGKYPVDLSEGYQKWFVWQARPYKAVDATFHSYAAYYWEITFEKYDRSEKYVVYMLEDGTIFTF